MRGHESGRLIGALRVALAVGAVVTAGGAVASGNIGRIRQDTGAALGSIPERALHRFSPIVDTDQQKRDWNRQITAKLDEKAPLSEGEEWTGEFEIVPAGETYAELLDMEANRTLVNVRDFPGIYTPDSGSTKVIGQLAQGTRIRRALIVNGPKPYSRAKGKWVAFRLEDVDKGILFNPKGNLDEKTIGVIYIDYTAPVNP
ncbi:MAG: hypothetical protein M1444_00505 [Patescibacteria group bacterium]|nr:hypothetical protein [Patescibacteria group bacterium]